MTDRTYQKGKERLRKLSIYNIQYSYLWPDIVEEPGLVLDPAHGVGELDVVPDVLLRKLHVGTTHLASR